LWLLPLPGMEQKISWINIRIASAATEFDSGFSKLKTNEFKTDSSHKRSSAGVTSVATEDS